MSEEAETRDMPWSKSPRMTAEKRMAIIRSTGSMPDILRATLRRGAYFRGAEGIHNMVEVHRVALRAAATLMRKVYGFPTECVIYGIILFSWDYTPPYIQEATWQSNE